MPDINILSLRDALGGATPSEWNFSAQLMAIGPGETPIPAVRVEGYTVTFPEQVTAVYGMSGTPEILTLDVPPANTWWKITLSSGSGDTNSRKVLNVVFPESAGPFDIEDLVEIDYLTFAPLDPSTAITAADAMTSAATSATSAAASASAASGSASAASASADAAADSATTAGAAATAAVTAADSGGILGSAPADFATAGQGALADTAVQPADLDPDVAALVGDPASDVATALNAAYGPRTKTVVVKASNSTADSADFVCTGTNDQTTINSAIASLGTSGGTVLLRVGSYNLSGAIVVNLPNVVLQGETRPYWGDGVNVEGTRSAKLKATVGNFNLVEFDSSGQIEGRLRGIGFRDIYFYGFGKTAGNIGIYDPIQDDFCQITGCKFHNLERAADLAWEVCDISHNSVQFCGTGIKLTYHYGVVGPGNAFYDLSGWGLFLEGEGHRAFDNLHGQTATPIVLNGADGCVIEGNVISGVKGSEPGIDLIGGANKNTIVGNTIAIHGVIPGLQPNPAGMGIRVGYTSACNSNTIVGNTIIANVTTTGFGVDCINGSTGNTIVGNNIVGPWNNNNSNKYVIREGTGNKLANNAGDAFDDTGWYAYSGTVENVTRGNGTVTGRVRRIGKTVEFSACLSVGSTTSITGPISFQLPINAADVSPLGFARGQFAAFYVRAGVGDKPGYASANNTRIYPKAVNAAGTYTEGAPITATVPFVPAIGDEYHVSAVYECV